MRPVIHIGPSKTASKSIQWLIPQMQVPHLIKPDWIKTLCRAPSISISPIPGVPDQLIVSAEVVGDFGAQPPKEVSNRLHQAFGPSTVIYVWREPEERCKSAWKQYLKNSPENPRTFDNFREWQLSAAPHGMGIFGNTRESLHAAFTEHTFRIVEFDLLKTNPNAFRDAFCKACGVSAPDIDFPWLNASA